MYIRMRYETQVMFEITLEQIEKYLLSKEWEFDEMAYGMKAKIFTHKKYFDSISLPTRDNFGDINLRIAEIIHTLERAEERAVPEILLEMGAHIFE